MKVFISHTFTPMDKVLGNTLQKVLKQRGITGYLAEKKKKYDLLIRDKIRNEIQRSDHLVAIITNSAKESLSVNQEIGYALGKDVPVAILLEKDAKMGVLTHGIEPEEFTRNNFSSSCLNIRSYLMRKGIRKKNSTRLKEKNKSNYYQKYSPSKKIQRLRTDTINAFTEYGYKHRKKILKSKSHEYRSPLKRTVDIVEHLKTKHRFFLDFYRDSIDDRDLGYLKEDIERLYFGNLLVSEQWKNMCFTITLGNITRNTIETHWGFRSRYNTTIPMDSSIFYHGVGEIGRVGHKQMKKWEFYRSMPKFFVYKIKSKDDVIDRIGQIEEFVDENPKIFNIVKKLKSFEKKVSVKTKKQKRRRRVSYRQIGGRRVRVRRA